MTAYQISKEIIEKHSILNLKRLKALEAKVQQDGLILRWYPSFGAEKQKAGRLKQR